ncbi:MAG TPA: flagellar type III secretion system pore protein FliP [Armatimonadota bacterium]|jgi:flagellar biosynthetic protein FliP
MSCRRTVAEDAVVGRAHAGRGAARYAGALARVALTLAGLWLLAGPAHAQAGIPVPRVSLGMDQAKSPQDVSLSLQILFLFTILSLAPALMLMVTSFTRIVIVLSFARTAIGTQQVPPNTVLIGLALFLTAFTMQPVWITVNNQALQPYLSKQITFNQAVEKGTTPVRDFMFRQTREKDLMLFLDLSKGPRPQTQDQVSNTVLVPAFMISELKTAFTMGFMLFIPFLIVDVVVAVTLMSMGMMMVPPALVSLPFKIMLFVLVDGWNLIVQSLAASFR